MFTLDTKPSIRDQYELCKSAWGRQFLPRLEEIAFVWSCEPQYDKSSLTVGETTILNYVSKGRYIVTILAPYFVVLEKLIPEYVGVAWNIVVSHELAHVSQAWQSKNLIELDHGEAFRNLMQKLNLPFEGTMPYDQDASGNMLLPGTGIQIGRVFEETLKLSRSCSHG